MASSSSEVIDTTKPTFDLSLRKSTANRLDYLYEISHVPEDSKIPITDFPIVNPYTVFDKPQVSFKKSIKKLLGPSQSSTVKEYVQASKFDQYNIPASETESLTSIIFQLVKQKISLPLHFLKSLYFHGRNRDTHTSTLEQ